MNTKTRPSLYRWAYVLALITIFYNIGEGTVSVLFGIEDETLSLFGFGLDSFVEVISGIGIWHMIRRIWNAGNVTPDKFEMQALKITGAAFYLLATGLIITAGINLYKGHHPVTTFWGIVVAFTSIFSMWALIHYKVRVGRLLDSQAILADANCTKACMSLSVVLLITSFGYEFTGIGGLDSVGSIVIAGLSFKEGHESFKKAKGIACSCSRNAHE